jgi:hypothetical protein
MRFLDQIPPDVIGLRLCRLLSGERLQMCETVIFSEGRSAVELTLRRAQISGRVEIEGKIDRHWADMITDPSGEWVGTVALDARSYGALKNRWMRCRVDSVDGQMPRAQQ